MNRTTGSIPALLLTAVLATGCATQRVPLEGGEAWRLHTIDDELLYGDSHIELKFDSPSQFSGFGGCNPYRGEYRYDDGAIDVLTVEPLGDNPQCPPEYREQEQRYLSILENATNYHEQCRLLRLRSENGSRMLFKR